ncbi:helix-turn-helix domain-containing protein [Halomonas sp. HG01]|uniref:helix-turn-helix domain-containing protein n=1 Tax=Halomonas sp. HG01 TaxID=1609967 RepID=UPI0009E5305E|nr:helix-turn-helix transcriptional regulator [Halomonas sp. HG01]
MTRQTSSSDQVNVQAGKVDAFCDRLKVAIDRAGGPTSMAYKADVSTSVINKWKNGKSEPQVTSLVKMARVAGVSVGWLATGEGDPEGGEPPAELGRPDADLDALEEIALKVLALIDKRRPDLSPKARARIVRLVYEFYIRQEQPMDEASLDNVIELAAFR